MASLSTVNDDIILEIGKLLLHDKSTLCALSLTYRNMYRIARKLIIRNIEVMVQGTYEIGIERYDQLIWTLESQPDLGANTLSLRLIWGSDTRWHDTDKDAANDRANRLLRLTPNIRCLDIQNYSHKCSPFTPPLQLLINLKQLEEITTMDPRSTVHEVVQLMQVPYLQTLEVPFMDVWVTPKVQSTTDMNIKPLASHLTGLRLPSDSHLDPLAFHFLLTVAPNLKNLSTNIPGLQPQEVLPSGRRAREALMLDELSPAGVLACLRPTQETLVELDLVNEGVPWPGHDGSRLDLSGYTCMKKISLPAACIFVPGGSWDGRKGLGDLLPKTIEDIVIAFDFLQGLLYTTSEIPSLFHGETNAVEALSSIDPERYSWLIDLVAHAASVPKLQNLFIKERLKGSHGVVFGWAKWQPPNALTTQFERTGWEVDVMVRLPKNYSPNVSGRRRSSNLGPQPSVLVDRHFLPI